MSGLTTGGAHYGAGAVVKEVSITEAAIIPLFNDRGGGTFHFAKNTFHFRKPTFHSRPPPGGGESGRPITGADSGEKGLFFFAGAFGADPQPTFARPREGGGPKPLSILKKQQHFARGGSRPLKRGMVAITEVTAIAVTDVFGVWGHYSLGVTIALAQNS